jgi:MFS superfamily sulfate permease-like transporter
VLIGYIHGVAVVLIVGQLGKLLGLDIDAQDPLAQLAEVVGELDDLSGATVAVGIACLAPLLLLRWRAPKIPGPLLVVVLAIAASAAIGWPRRAWPSSARSHLACPASSSPAWIAPMCWPCCRRPWAR